MVLAAIDDSMFSCLVLISLSKRGLVPSINYNGTIITESAVVTQFLVDAHQSHLLPPTTSVSNAVFRARVAFFVDAFISKVLPQIFAGWRAQTEAEKDANAEALVAAVVKEVEPLFNWTEGKGPFFEGSERLTLAEVSSPRLLGPMNARLTFHRRFKRALFSFDCCPLASPSTAS